MPKKSTARAARIIMTPFIVVILLAPVVACHYVESLSARLAAIVVAAAVFVAISTLR